MSRTALWGIACLLLLATLAAAAPPRFADGQARPVTRAFELRELLEHDYADELVSFGVSFAAREVRPESLRLLDDTGGEVTYQLAGARVSSDGYLQSAQVWFWVDRLPALGQRAYTLYGSPSGKCKPPAAQARTGVTVKEAPGAPVEVTNGLFSLRLAGSAQYSPPRAAKEIGGPLQAFQGTDGVWRGAGELQVESPLTGSSFRVVEQGPLWTTVAVRQEFVAPPGTGGTSAGPYYEMRFTLYPGRDFCRVDEKSDFPLRLQPMPRDVTGIPVDAAKTDNWRTVPCPADNFLLNCEANWKADRLYAANTFSTQFVNHPLLPEQFRIHTALRPALPFMDAGWFSTYSTQGQDLLGLVGVDASHWQYPDNSAHPTARTPGMHTDVMFVNEPGRGAYFRLPLARMERHWLLVVTTREKVVKDPEWVAAQKKKSHMYFFADRIEPETCYLWQLRYKFGDLPLNKVKNWKLDYPEPQAEHPGLFPEARDREAVLRNIMSLPGLKQHYDAMLTSSPYLQYLTTGQVVEKDREGQPTFDPFSGVSCVKENLSQGFNAYIYVLSTGQYVPGMLQFCDLTAPGITPENWQRMCRFALAGTYLLADDDYWQYTYVRGDTTYLPNFNTCRWSGIGLAGLFFRNHPEAQKWIDFSRYYLEKEFDYYVSPDGVGAENLGNYYPFAWRMFSTLIRIFQDRGLADYRSDPKYLAGARFWLDVLTPPDVRFNPPRRMVPPIGNHPYSSPGFGMHEWNANTFQKTQPELAAWSHWAWLQCGQQADFHHLFPLNFLWANKDFAAKVPPLQSKPLEGFGYIFRNHFPGEKETYLSFKAGYFFFHHDGDEGSFHMYAKGVPLACDGLELIGYTGPHVHNMMEIKPQGDKWVTPRGGTVVDHFESPTVDWAAGFFAKENTRGAEHVEANPHRTDWRRDLFLIKAANPEDPEYFVAADHLSGPEGGFWNLDVHSEEPTIETAAPDAPATVRFPGIRKPEYNVGLDVIFVAPANPKLEKEKGTVNQAQFGKFPQVEHWFLHSPRDPQEDTLAVLYPRRPDQPAPRVTPLLGGRGCVVTHSAGRDVIIASPVPLTWAGEGVEFTGRYAIIRNRGAESSLTLLDGTRLSFRGKTLTARGTTGL